MNDLDGIWRWMEKRKQQLLDDEKATAEAEARDDAHADCSTAELQRQARQDAKRREVRNDANGFYRCSGSNSNQEQS